jgi:hypothetical protein
MQELKADHIAYILMAKAGFDPQHFLKHRIQEAEENEDDEDKALSVRLSSSSHISKKC